MKKLTQKQLKWIIIVLAVIFICSTGALIYMDIDSRNNENQVNALREQINSRLTSLLEDTSEQIEEEAAVMYLKQMRDELLESYSEMYQQNSDFVGWITIEGTCIDYPIMQHSSEKDYYLHRDFYKNYSASGTPYAQENCDVFTPSDNVILHGHHLKSGNMFTDLLKYKEMSFWQEHQYITFNTREELHTYQVFGCFVVEVNTLNDPFEYYNFINAANENEFNNYVSTVKSYSYYDTGITPVYGDKLLTLSTCDYVLGDCRCVVVAVRIDEEMSE